MTNLFDDQSNKTPIQEDFQLDESKNYFEELVGENKKFKTPEDLAKGKAMSDHYVKTLEQRLDEMREDYTKLSTEYNAGASLRELLEEMRNTQKQDTSGSAMNPNADEGNQERTPTFDVKNIEQMIAQEIAKNEAAKRQEQNFAEVQRKLKEQFGNNYAAELKAKAEELGLSTDFANDLARNHPAVFYKTFGIGEGQGNNQFQAPPRSQTRTDNFAPNAGNKRTWTYYQKMRKENPRLYNDPKTTVQMHKDAIELGSAFQDGDFNEGY